MKFLIHHRYRAVTDLQYRAKCSFKRLSICVTSMWLAAIFLSVTPLILERIIDFYGSQNSTNKMNQQVANKFFGSHLFGGLHQILVEWASVSKRANIKIFTH